MKKSLSHIRVIRLAAISCLIGVIFIARASFAADAAADAQASADTAWVLACSALVMLMTPGLGLFYAGMVRRKNVLATILQSFIMIGLVGVLWILFGYSLAFGKDHWGIIGSLDWIGLRNVGLTPNPAYSKTLPHQAFMIYQAMFAIITPALITGAFAERIRFKSFIIFAILWTTLIYDPVCHWMWAPGGWLRELGALDFAGGVVVHVTSGIAALTCAIALGKRRGYGTDELMPHNVTMTLIGTGMLWFGWFGFNAGSALGANTVAVTAFVSTNTAGATAAMAWLMLEWWHRGKPTALGAATGAVAGLAAVTPASGYIGPMAAVAIGLVVTVICYCAIILKGRLGYDDSLDVFGVHGVGGIWGVLATGIFASAVINPAAANGLVHGGHALIWKQILAIVVVAAYTFILTSILLKITGVISPLRVEKDEEESGLDLSQHGEAGYHF